MATQKNETECRNPKDMNISKLIEDAQEAFYKDPNVIGVRIEEPRKGGETQHDEIVLTPSSPFSIR